VQDLGGQFELSLALLRDGDSRRPLAVPWDDTAQRRFDAVVTHWHQLKPVWLGTAPPLPAQASQRAVAIVTDIDAFVAAVEHALARWTAILSLAQMGLMVLAIGAALLLMLAGQALVLSPLARLGEGLARVEEGDLSTRADASAVRWSDEANRKYLLLASDCLPASHLAGAIEGLRAAALQRETAVAEERSFIARELHDSIAQSLAFLKIQLGLLRNDIKSATAARIDRTLGELDAGVHESLATCANCWCTSAPAPTAKTSRPPADHAAEVRAPDRPGHPPGHRRRRHAAAGRTCRCRCCTWCRRPCPTCASMRRRARCGWKCSRRRSGAWRCATTAAASTPMAPAPTRPMWACASCANAPSAHRRHGGVASVPGSGTCVVLKLPERLGLAA
jgi:hypothetical protein